MGGGLELGEAGFPGTDGDEAWDSPQQGKDKKRDSRSFVGVNAFYL